MCRYYILNVSLWKLKLLIYLDIIFGLIDDVIKVICYKDILEYILYNNLNINKLL